MGCPLEFMKFSLASVSIFYKVESYHVCKSKLQLVHEPHKQPSTIARPTVCQGLISFTQTNIHTCINHNRGLALKKIIKKEILKAREISPNSPFISSFIIEDGI